MSKSNPIMKLEYRWHRFDVSKMRPGDKTVTTILRGEEGDCLILEQSYEPGCRKAYLTKRATCTQEEFQSLCDKLEHCIDTANFWDLFVDDCSAELKLVYKYNRQQKVDRGLSNGDTYVGRIIGDFILNLNLDE